MPTEILGALIGLIGPALVAGVGLFFKHRRDRNLQLHKLAYWQVVRYAPTEGPPDYTATVARLDSPMREVEVRHEVHLFRLNVFASKRSDFCTRDRSSGTVDTYIIHPYQDEQIFTDEGARINPSICEQPLQEPSSVLLSKSIYYNGLAAGHEDFSSRMECRTAEARLVVDLSSLPDRDLVLSGLPRGSLSRSAKNKKETRSVSEHRPGVYSLDARDLEMNDVLRIQFSLSPAESSRGVRG